MLALDVIDGGGRLHQLVLKLYTPEPTEPNSPQREAHILDLLRTTDLKVPRVVAIDNDGVECEMPALLMTRLPGKPRIWPRQVEQWVKDLAASAVRIHAIAISPDSLPEYSRYEHEKPKAPSWSKQPAMWKKAIAAFEEPAPDHSKTFIHRDFHAGNIVWSGSEVAGIVDWLHGCWGPPEHDLAHCRLNLWLNQGPAAADALLDAYYRALPLPVQGRGLGRGALTRESARAESRLPPPPIQGGGLGRGAFTRKTHHPYHPYWDLDEALGNHGTEDPPGSPRRFEAFIAAAVSKL